MTSDAIRRAYADEVRAAAHIDDDALFAAFARVPRERFLGPGPWHVATLDPTAPYRVTADGDPAHVLHDVVVAIDPTRQLNNGQPSALARWIHAAAPRAGDRVLHLGCGVGYYTAIIAELVGAGGRVVGIELDPALAARARDLLAPWSQATVEAGDGGTPGGPYDAIFVNAGATHPRRAWIDALADGGRLVVPLTAHVPRFPHGVGVVLRAVRAGERWPATVVSPVGIYDCAGARDDAAEAQVRALLAGGANRITALVTTPHPRGPACLVHTDEACVQASDAPAA